MKDKINIIQFMPYFPPHKWGLETHWEQWGKYWVKNGFWKVYNVVTSFEQEIPLSISSQEREVEQIIYLDEVIWYKIDGVEILVCPSVEIISNFPVYKFWSKEYKIIIRYLEEKNIDIIITRTRFFLTSFLWWLFARKNKIKWIHIEHGSDYVKLNSKFKNLVAKIYDKWIWKWIFKKADKVIWVSEACKRFIQKEFVNREVWVIYRGVDLPGIIDEWALKNKFWGKIIIWFVWRLFKWKNVDTLIKSYYSLDKDLKNKIQIVIVGEWEDFDRLNKLDLDKEIYFTWWKSFKEALELQNEFDIHFHTSSPGWWLATTLLQAMSLWKFIISTPYEWADEVIVDWKNGILLKDDSLEELKRWLEKWLILFEDKKKEFEIENKKIFKEKFDWDKNILKYYKLFNEE
jgi:glycosyltransferase involved in cell wall biosynthesis